MQKLLYAFVGLLLGLSAFLLVWRPWEASTNFAGGTSISQLADRAFGSLAAVASPRAAPVAMGKGGGGADMAVREGDTMPPHEMTTYKFIYDGSIDLTDTTVDVLQRVRQIDPSAGLTSRLLSFDLGLIDLNKLVQPSVLTFSLSEEREFGYEAYINFTEGSVNVNQKYLSWPDPYRDCREESCYQALRMGEQDMLDNAALLQIAVDFVQQMSFDISSYGQPMVQTNWRSDLARIESPADFYYPEVINVIYPLQMKGATVYNESGDPDGITISINQRFQKVVNLWGLFVQRYESSSYPATRDQALVRDFLERGGLWNWYPENPTKVVEVKLGSPEKVLLKHWIYEGNNTSELTVPALRFPILEKPVGEYIYQNAVMIPLVQEILDNAAKNNSSPRPMPLVEPTNTAADATTATTSPASEATTEGAAINTSIANPASTKCVKDGYKNEIRQNADDSQTGYCVDANGKECEEWAYFRGECSMI